MGDDDVLDEEGNARLKLKMERLLKNLMLEW